MAAYRPPNPPPSTTICASFRCMRSFLSSVESSSDLGQDVGIKHQHRSERGDGDYQEEADELRRQTARHNLGVFLKILRLLTALPEERTVDDHDEQRQDDLDVEPLAQGGVERDPIPFEHVP